MPTGLPDDSAATTNDWRWPEFDRLATVADQLPVSFSLVINQKAAGAPPHDPAVDYDGSGSILLKNSICVAHESGFGKDDLIKRPLLNATQAVDHLTPPKVTPENPPQEFFNRIGRTAAVSDGTSVWVADFSGSVSIINMNTLVLTNISAGFTHPVGVLYDGAHIWVTDYGAGKLLQLGPTGTILNSVTVGAGPSQPVFDGENIWVPNSLDNSITVVQASTAKVVATIVSDGVNNLSGPEQASFDGERILVTNPTGSSFTLFKAADLSVIANVSTAAGAFGGSPRGTCSDGIQFWLTISGSPFMTRF